MTDLKILEWNIHQQGRHTKEIPLDIVDYIMHDGEDVIVLLEINTHSNNFCDFCEMFNEKGYRIYMTCYQECDYANDTFIAVNSKSNMLVKKASYHIAYHRSYVIGGVRIKELCGNYQMRRNQMETLINWTNEIDVPMILLGDFNNLKEGTPEQRWNLEVLDRIIEGKFIRKTPEYNCSWGVAYYPHSKKYDGYIKEDHLLLSTSIHQVGEVCLAYCWNYLSGNIDGFCMGAINQYGQQNIDVPIGFPDHAIFKARIPLE